MITVVNKHKYTGPMIYIGRGSVFGNPFPVSMGRDQCIEAYKKRFYTMMNGPNNELKLAVFALIKRAAKGEDLYLACFCAPKACHGDVIKQYIESQLHNYWA